MQKPISCIDSRGPLWGRMSATVIALFLICQAIHAAPFRDLVIPFKQPDGTTVEIIGWGDEFSAVFETREGYTVVFDSAHNAYCYAQLGADGHLVSTGKEVQQADPRGLGLQKHLRASAQVEKAERLARRQQWEQGVQINKRWKAQKAMMRQYETARLQGEPPPVTTTGTKVGLCLLVEFTDDAATVPQADIVNFCNGDSYTGYGNNGSVKKFFQDNSNGALTYTNVVTVYIKLGAKTTYNDLNRETGFCGNDLIRDAVAAMIALPNYTSEILPAFDALTVDDNNRVIACNVFFAGKNSGKWNYGLWPHSWVLAEVGEQALSSGGKKIWSYQITDISDKLAIGTFCHENGHMLCGFPDIYDYDSGAEASVGGAGMFCLMGHGNNADAGRNPVQICAYLKRAAGWATATELNSMSALIATVTALPGTNFNHFYRYQRPGVPTEYFLAECRHTSGRDTGLPAAGVAIWHIDELGNKDDQNLIPNSTHSNYECTLEQADNRWDFQYNVNDGDSYDLFYSENSAPGYANKFSDFSNPSARWWDGTSSGLNFHSFSSQGPTMTFSVNSASLIYQTNSVVGGNGNGQIDPNECNELFVVLTNSGEIAITGISSTLITTNPSVIVLQPVSTYPNIAGGTNATNRVAFKVSTSPAFVSGVPIDFALVIKGDQGSWTNEFRLLTGTPGTPIRFENNIVTAIPDADPMGTNSTITVTNVNTALSKVTAAIHLVHPSDIDLKIELVAPDGTSVMLVTNMNPMLSAKGQNFGSSCSSDLVRTVFDDNATNTVGAGMAPFVGSYKPLQPLSVFLGRFGTNVNGTWRLRVTDGLLADTGSLQCWSLSLTPTISTDGGGECPGVDLSVNMSATPEPALLTSNLTYSIMVSNAGPSATKGVILNHSLFAGATLVSVSTPQGSWKLSGDTVVCNLGTMLARSSVAISVVVAPTVAGVFTSTASVGSIDSDYNLANNVATVRNSVQQATADLSVSVADSPDPILGGGSLTYTITVTNNGPFNATGVILTNLIPLSCNVVSKSASQGTFVTAGNTVLALLGTIPARAGATVSIVATPSTPGLITETSQISCDQVDPIPGNNRASVTTTVTPAADVAVVSVAQPSPVVVGRQLTYTTTITNRGPATATMVSLSQILPVGSSFVSASSTQGTPTNLSGTVNCMIGTLPPKASAVVTIQVLAPVRETVATSTARISRAEADSNESNDTFTVTTAVSTPNTTYKAAGAKLLFESFSPANGAIDPYETVTLELLVQNTGNTPGSNVVGTLLSTGGVTSHSLPQGYGVLNPGAIPTSRPFNFTASGTNGGAITATLQVQDGLSSTNLQFTFSFPVVTVFSNSTSIVIPDSGIASPYPSEIVVSNVTAAVSKVSATLVDFNHSYPSDVTALLVSPSGQKTILMSHAGTAESYNANLTFDDAGRIELPAKGSLSSDVYRNTAYGELPEFPTNTPAAPYSTIMGVFSGTNPDGVWALYLLDDQGGDEGIVTKGWQLAFTTISPINKIADLALSATGPANPLTIGDLVTNTYVIQNNGPDEASNVALTNTFSSGLNFVAANLPSGASFSTNATAVFCNLGSLASGSNVTISIVATVTSAGTLSEAVSIGATEVDLNSANNSATVSVTVIRPPADLALSMTATAGPVVVKSNMTYNFSIVNSGPNAARKVWITNTLPANVVFVSASVPWVQNGSVVALSVGDIAIGAETSASMVVAPQVTGTLVNTAEVGSLICSDPTLENNVATASTIISAPFASIVSGAARLISESLVQNGAIDAGETVSVAFTLVNVGSAGTANLSAVLQATGGITPITSTQTYGAIAPGANSSQVFTFSASGQAGAPICASFALFEGGLSFGTASFNFVLPSTTQFVNTGFINIPVRGPANPYPSTIVVSNVAGVVTEVALTLTNFSHTYPRDIHAMLVGPQGQKAVFLGKAGASYGFTNLTLTFKDAASGQIAPDSALSSGTYKPSDFAPAYVFPGQSTSVGNTSFGVFRGSLPNGTWSLFVADDNNGDYGSIGGWNISLTTAETVRPAADISVSVQAAARMLTGIELPYNITVQNKGPNTAEDVVLSDSLPTGMTLMSATPSQGLVTESSGTLVCNFGAVPAGTSVSLALVVVPNRAGSYLNSVSVTTGSTDLFQDDNADDVSTLVADPAPLLISAVCVLNGSLSFQVHGEPGLTYEIQSSSDMVSWTTCERVTLQFGGSYPFSEAAGAGAKFYRVIRIR